MLSRDELVRHYRDSLPTRVLSVYLDTDQHDPAQRRSWRTRLDGLRATLKRSKPPDIEAMEGAWARVEAELSGCDSFLPGQGWVAFATPDRLIHAESVPVPVPDRVRWGPGMLVAPYVRGLKQNRPVVVALTDSRKSRIFVYEGGRILEVEDLRADTFLGDLSDVGVSKRSGNASGVRGATATDQAKDALEVVSDRLLREVAGLLVARCESAGLIVLGGPGETVSKLGGLLPKSVVGHVVEAPELHLHMTASELAAAMTQLASDHTQRLQEEFVDQIVSEAQAGGRASLGPADTGEALEQKRVETLLLSRDLLHRDPDRADEWVGSALCQDAVVEEVGGAPGQRLEEEGGGVGARLRYTL